jgi:hypothetical protein
MTRRAATKAATNCRSAPEGADGADEGREGKILPEEVCGVWS